MQEKFVLRTLKKIAAISTGVVMAGATITGALALDLADYPSPFVADGVYDDANALVVGDNANAADTLGMVDIATNLQYESKTAVTSDSTTVSVDGGVTKQVAVGSTLVTTGYFDQAMQDDEVSNLVDGTITFQGSTYDVSEELNLSSSGPRIVNSLASNSDDDYTSNVYMDVQAKDYIKFYYRFDESINISSATSDQPLEIDFLGQHFKITSFDSGSTKFTAYVGDSHYLVADESVEVEGKTITLIDVGSSSVVVEVDGVEEIISSGNAETVNGIEIAVDEVFSRTERAESSASLVIGLEASKTYQDGDAFPGEDEDDPNWVWDLSGLYTANPTTSQIFGIENDFVYNDASDVGLPAVGGCITLPNDYVEICLDSLSVDDADYATYTFEVDENLDATPTLGSGNTSLDALHITSSVSEGLELQAYSGACFDSNATNTVKTENVWIYTTYNTQSIDGTTMNESIDVFYQDDANKIRYFGSLDGNLTCVNSEIVRFNYENTKSTNVVLKTGRGLASLDPLTSSRLHVYLDVQPDVSTDMLGTKENLTMVWGISTDIAYLGDTADTEEADELNWTVTSIGSKDEDHRTYYGIIIQDPKTNGASDNVELMVPNDQVFANVVIKGTSTTVSAGSTTYVPAEVTPATMLASEVSSASDYNLILVGGPCANDLVESVFDMTCDGWAYETGEAVVKLVENGDNVALLVAGSSADDTRRAARAVANYGDYDFSGSEVMVSGSSLTDIEVGAIPEETVEEVAEETTEETAEE